MRRPMCLVCLLFVLTLAGIQFFLPPATIRPGALCDTEQTLSGEVVRIEDNKEIYVIYLEQICISGISPSKINKNKNIKAICYFKQKNSLKIGNRIKVTGRVKSFLTDRNPGQFDQEGYYAQKGYCFALKDCQIDACSSTYCPYRNSLHVIRTFLAKVLEDSFSERDASIMKAILLGDRSDMDKEQKNLYQQSGIAHILAISGLHISILGAALYKILQMTGLRKEVAAVIAGCFIFSYGIMVGLGPGVIRAIGMFLLTLLAQLLKRSYDMLSALALLAVVVLIQQPLYLYDGGFQLSFAAILGAGLVQPAMMPQREFRHKKTVTSMVSCFSVFITTLPVMLWNFYEISVLSLLWNLCVIPLLGVLLACGIGVLTLGGLQGILPVPVAMAVSICNRLPIRLAEGILRFYDVLCYVNSQIPFAVLHVGRPQLWQAFVAYLCLATAVLLNKKPVKYRVICIGCMVFTLLLPSHNNFCITFLDVGQGDGICIELPNKKVCMIDGGSSSDAQIGEYTLQPFLKQRGDYRIEYWFVTHPDEDHCNGLRYLLSHPENGIKIKNLVLSGAGSKLSSNEELCKLAEHRGIRVLYLQKGDAIQIGKMRIMCTYPTKNQQAEEANESSMVLLLQYDSFSALLPGDAGDAWEESSNLPIQTIDVYKVAHHGSAKNCNSAAYIDKVRPRISVISCGIDNVYGHPHAETLMRLKKCNSKVFLTTECGAVSVHVQKGNLRVCRYIGENEEE